MSLVDPALPFGIRRIGLRPYEADGETLGNGIRLPVGRTLGFKETQDFETLEGDDVVVATHGKAAMVDWDLEAGGISMAAWALMSGATLTASGTTPNLKKKLAKKANTQRPYFQIEGQIIGDTQGDTHVTIHRAKLTSDLEGSFEYGNFMVTQASGTGIGTIDDDDLWTVTQNETAEDITLTDP